MHESAKENYEAQLESDMRSREYLTLLQSSQPDHPALMRFNDWASAVEFTRSRSSDRKTKNRIFAAVLQVRSDAGDSRWNTVILAMLLPALNSIYKRTFAWDREPDELWQNIVTTCLEAVREAEQKHNSRRLIERIYSTTVSARGIFTLALSKNQSVHGSVTV